MNVLACQIAIPETRSFEDKRDHVRRTADAVEKAFQSGEPADLVILPELSVIEYSTACFDHLDALAEDRAGFSYQCFSALARKLGCCIAYGFPRRENGRCYISHAFIGPSGEYLTHYDKIHIAHLGASAEKPYFSPGNRIVTLDIKGCTVSIIICYDFRFPQLTSHLCGLYDIDLIIHPVSFPKDTTVQSWHPFAMCRAVENEVYFLSLNRAGDHWGNSIFCPPWMDDGLEPSVFGPDEEFRRFEIDRALLKSVRDQYPLTKDKLDDYSLLIPTG